MSPGPLGLEATHVLMDLSEFEVATGTYHVSPEPLLLTADLCGALALCIHDERRSVGGLLHLCFGGVDGRPSEVTDNSLNQVLVVLDRFKRAVLGNAPRPDEVHARIIAHAFPPVDAGEPSATLVDLIRADLAGGRLTCGAQVVRRTESVRLYFEPFAGRMWLSGPDDVRSAAARRHRL